MTNIETMLMEFHRAEAGEPLRWGQNDCSMRLANWWRYVHQEDDPAAFLRGTYGSSKGAFMACLRAGGLLRLVATIAERVEAEKLATMTIGSFGVIDLAGKPRGFIAARDMISVRSDNGVAFLPPDAGRVLGVWDIV